MATKGIVIDEDDAGTRVVPTLQEIRDLLKGLGPLTGNRTSGPNSVNDIKTPVAPFILGQEERKRWEEQERDKAVSARSKEIRSERINSDALGRAIPQLLNRDILGALNTRANAGAAQASLAGDTLKAESILAGASKMNAAFAIASTAAEVGAEALRGFRGAVQQAGDNARKLANNDTLGLVSGAAEGAAASLEKIPVVGKLQAEAIRTATAAVSEFTKTVDAFVERGKELSKYNADLAAANAQADVRRLEQNIAEADRLGKSVSRLTDAESRLDDTFREVMLPIKQLIAEILADLVEPAADIIGIAKPAIVTLLELVKSILDAVRSANPLNRVRDGISSVRKLVDGESDEGQLNSIMEKFLGAGGAAPALAPPAAGRADSPTSGFAQTVSTPIFVGG